MKKIPLHSLIITVGPKNSGKTTFLKRHFKSYEIINSDDIRYELVGDNTRFDINSQVFNEIYKRATLKLTLGERVIIDTSNLKKEDRISLVQIGINLGVPVFYFIIDRPLEEKLVGQMNKSIIEKQDQIFKNCEYDILRGDGLAEVVDTRTTDFNIINKTTSMLLTDIKQRGFTGITVFADLHGMLQSLLNGISWARSRNHFMLFLGDAIDYGRETLEVADEVYRVCMRGEGEFIHGNHEKKINRWLDETEEGRSKLFLSDGNLVTINAILQLSTNDRKRWVNRFRGLMALSRQHRCIGNYIFSHASIHSEFWTLNERRLPKFLESRAMIGELDRHNPYKDGRPNLIYDWIEDIPNNHVGIVGHTIRSKIKPLVIDNNNGGRVIFLDTGCGKGGHLSTADLKFDENDTLILENFNRH